MEDLVVKNKLLLNSFEGESSLFLSPTHSHSSPGSFRGRVKVTIVHKLIKINVQNFLLHKDSHQHMSLCNNVTGSTQSQLMGKNHAKQFIK